MKAFVSGFGNSRQGQEAFYLKYQWETTACQLKENLRLQRIIDSALFAGETACYQFSIMLALSERSKTRHTTSAMNNLKGTKITRNCYGENTIRQLCKLKQLQLNIKCLQLARPGRCFLRKVLHQHLQVYSCPFDNNPGHSSAAVEPFQLWSLL